MLKATPQRTRLLTYGFVLLVNLASLANAQSAEDERFQRWRIKGADFEKRGAWLEACRCYDEALRLNRNHLTTRDSYHRCLRRLQLIIRHRDTRYTNAVSRLDSFQALSIYEQVLVVVSSSFADRTRTTPAALFQQGLQEVRFALDEAIFSQKHLSGVKPADLATFRAQLAEWGERKVVSFADASKQVMAIVEAGQKARVLLRESQLAVFILEFAAGACNALDEYSSFVTPNHLTLLQAALRGKLVGVGLELADYGGQAQVSRVLLKSSAYDAGLARNDRIVRIDRMPTEDVPADDIMERLRGPAGTSVEVEFIRPTDPTRTRRLLKLVRRAVSLPSVEFELMEMDGVPVGYLRINHFQDSTLQEVKEALASWQSAGPDTIKGMILDLRGNPGGLFKSSVRVAELFLSEGVIVVSTSPRPEYNRPFKVESAGPVQLPLVVLIDGETASAAEVLAGALKEGRSGPGRVPVRLLGQTTYGKGSIQCMISMDRPPLDKMPGGIRLTVAKLFSPSNQPYTGRGIEPHEFLQPDADPFVEARRQLQGMLNPLMGVAKAPLPGPTM